jgi:hypothetical protein
VEPGWGPNYLLYFSWTCRMCFISKIFYHTFPVFLLSFYYLWRMGNFLARGLNELFRWNNSCPWDRFSRTRAHAPGLIFAAPSTGKSYGKSCNLRARG